MEIARYLDGRLLEAREGEHYVRRPGAPWSAVAVTQGLFLDGREILPDLVVISDDAGRFTWESDEARDWVRELADWTADQAAAKANNGGCWWQIAELETLDRNVRARPLVERSRLLSIEGWLSNARSAGPEGWQAVREGLLDWSKRALDLASEASARREALLEDRDAYCGGSEWAQAAFERLAAKENEEWASWRMPSRDIAIVLRAVDDAGGDPRGVSVGAEHLLWPDSWGGFIPTPLSGDLF